MLDSPRIGAGIAQLVERKLPKLEVAGSRPVARSNSLLLRLAEQAGMWLKSLRRQARSLASSEARAPGGMSGSGGAPTGGHTIIGIKTRFKGRLKGQGEVVVCGTFLGEVDLAGPLTLAATGRMEADVEVQSAKLAGKARGTMRASDRIRLDATARFEGEIATPVIELRPGSVLRGRASILGRRNSPAVR